MHADHGSRGRAWTLSLADWLLVLCVVLALPGCATHMGAAGDAQRDVMTDSDEPEARKRARIRLELAVGYFEQGQTTVALDEVKQAVAADPGYAQAHNVRGLIYMRLNNLELADESFRRALALNPGDPNVMHNHGWLLCQQGRHDEAMQRFVQALAHPTYGGRAKTWLTQGLCQARAGKADDAEYSLSRAYELDPAQPVTTYNLALLQYRRGDLVRAQFHARRLNNSELANAESLWLGIRIEYKRGEYAAVEQLAAQLRKRYPQSRELQAYERREFNE